jgi:hypothetical protein
VYNLAVSAHPKSTFESGGFFKKTPTSVLFQKEFSKIDAKEHGNCLPPHKAMASIKEADI